MGNEFENILLLQSVSWHAIFHLHIHSSRGFLFHVILSGFVTFFSLLFLILPDLTRVFLFLCQLAYPSEIVLAVSWLGLVFCSFLVISSICCYRLMMMIIKVFFSHTGLWTTTKNKSYIYFIPFLDRNKYETSLSKFKIGLRQGTTKFIWKQSQTRLSAHVIFKVCKKDTISCTGHEILIRERRSLFIIDF